MKLKKFDYIMLAIIIVGVVIALLIVNNGNSFSTEGNNKNEDRVLLLSDYSRFFTIESSLYKFIGFLQTKDTESLIKIVDKSFIDSNNVTTDNVLDFFGNLDGSYSFESKKVYYKNISDTLIKYYVMGDVVEDSIDSYTNNRFNSYYIVVLDTKNKTFSVMPYDGSVFKEEV